MLTENIQAVCVMFVHNRNTSTDIEFKKLAKKHALWFISVCDLWHSMKVFFSLHNANAPGFSCSDI